MAECMDVRVCSQPFIFHREISMVRKVRFYRYFVFAEWPARWKKTLLYILLPRSAFYEPRKYYRSYSLYCATKHLQNYISRFLLSCYFALASSFFVSYPELLVFRYCGLVVLQITIIKPYALVSLSEWYKTGEEEKIMIMIICWIVIWT